MQILYPQSLECQEARDRAEVKEDQAAFEDRDIDTENRKS